MSSKSPRPIFDLPVFNFHFWKIVYLLSFCFFASPMTATGSNCSQTTISPNHQYSFENSADGWIFDSIGGMDGQLSKASISTGKSGSGVFFANSLTNARVQMHPFDLDIDQGITVSFWIKPLNFNSVEARYISKAQGTNEDDHDLMVSAYEGSKLRFRLRINNNTETLITQNKVLIANSWNHIAATFDKTAMRIYHNGLLVAQRGYTGSINFRDTALAFGNQPVNAGDRPFWGTLDEVSLFGRGLTAQDIALLAGDTDACGDADDTPQDAAPADSYEPLVIDPAKMFQNAQLVFNGHATTIAPGDIDGDGDLDIFAAEGGKHSCGSSCRLLAWFEAPTWRRHDLGGLLGPFTGDSVLVDIDKDGDLDVVISVDNHNSESSTDAVYWYENRVNKKLSWVRHTIEYNVPNAYHIGEMDSADVDGDGKMDIVVRHLSSYRFVVYFQNSADSWTPRRLNTRPREGLKLADLDGNKRVDIIGNGFVLFAPLSPRTQTWTEKTIDSAYYSAAKTGLNNSAKADVADLNGDGRLDIVMSSAEGNAVYLAWYKSPSDPKTGSWGKYIIEKPQANNHQVQIADVDLDGDLDIVGGFSFGDRGVYWWENVNATATTWERHLINSSNGCYSCKVADFDGDGDHDVAGPTKYAGSIYFYKNVLMEMGGAAN